MFLDTVRLGLEAGVGRLVLWHLNQDRDDDGVDAMHREAVDAVAAAGSSMRCVMARGGAVLDI